MKLRLLFASLLAIGASQLHAQLFEVKALDNSSTPGFGLPTISLNAGDAFSVSVDPTDLWSAGGLPRWSNADGLIQNLFATGSDESGQPAGTQIGAVFPLWTENGFTAPYGSLVGEIGSTFILLGTSFSGVAPESGTLQLFYWDSNNGDNSGSIMADISVPNSMPNSAVPEPSTYALLGALALAAVAVRRSLNRKA